jgi:aspartyl-tRNA(Asn)/glutamyl-tRNA(Gln) amidotransferase subunit A
MGRTVADVALLQNLIAGAHPDDHVSLPASPLLRPDPDLHGRRIALVTAFGDYGIDPEVVAAVESSAAWLTAAGATVESVSLPFEHRRIITTALAHFGSVFVPWIESEVGPDRLDRLQPYTRQAIRHSHEAFAELGVLGTLYREAEVHAILADVFRTFDAIVCPTLAVPSYRADDYYEDGLTVAGVHYSSHIGAALTVPFNIANRCPVLDVPVARSRNDVPIGAQIVARPYDDATVFDVGAAIELGRGGWYGSPEHRPTFQAR